MTRLEKFKEGALGPTLVLTLICLVIVFALAKTYQVTKPTIDQVEKQRADEARALVLPGAGEVGFTELSLVLPEGVSEAFAADNGAGYVFKSAAKGFGGDVHFMVGMDSEGKVTGIKLFSHDETPGLGTKVGSGAYLSQFHGDTDPNSIDAITGATKTSNALKNALQGAREAYALVS